MAREKVLVGMSGGVDSAAAAALLKEEGFEVTGCILRLLPGDEAWEQNLADAQAVAANGNATQEEVGAAADSLKAAMSGLVFVNGDNDNDADTDDTTTGGVATTPAGDGTAPSKTGDAGAAGIAVLALASAAAVVLMKKKR